MSTRPMFSLTSPFSPARGFATPTRLAFVGLLVLLAAQMAANRTASADDAPAQAKPSTDAAAPQAGQAPTKTKPPADAAARPDDTKQQGAVSPKPAEPQKADTDADARGTEQTGAKTAAIDFATHIAPILNKYCVGCHAADEPEGQLVLETFAGLQKGGEHGAVIVPGSSKKSRLIQVLTGQAEPSMPPEDNEAPTPEEIARLAAWIDAGAPAPAAHQPSRPRRLEVPKIQPNVAPRDAVTSIAFSPDGKRLALGHYRKVRLVDVKSRSTVRVLSGLTGNVNQIRFQGNERLWTASGEPGAWGELALWDLASGKMLERRVAHRDALYALALDPAGNRIATAGYDHDILLWNPQQADPVATLSGHNGAVFDLAFRPDGRVLASASADRTVKLWDVEAAQRLDTLSEATKPLYCLAFSPDGKRLAAGGVDRRIRIWRLSESAAEDSNPIQVSRIGHLGTIIQLAWSPDGKWLVSTSEDGTVKIWQTEPLTQQIQLEPQPDWPDAVAISPDSRQLAVARLDGSFALYTLRSGKPVPPPKPELASVVPGGVQRGGASRLLLTGKYLLGATAIETNHEKLVGRVIAADAAGASDHRRLSIELTAAADLPRGEYKLAIVTPGGKSRAIEVQVDSVPQQAEQEPNDTLAAAQSLALPGAVWGTIRQLGDVDVFAVAATAGQHLVIEVAAASLRSKLDATLTLYGPDGRVLATNNDFEGRRDPLIAHTIQHDGLYHIQVSSLTLDGSEKHRYRLTVGQFPYVTGVYPLGIPAGSEVSLELTGFNLPADARLVAKAEEPGELKLPVDRERFRGASQVKVVVGSSDEQREQEPNDLSEQAMQLAVPTTVNGRIWHRGDGQATDVDLYRFEARSQQPLVLEISAAQHDSPIDTKIEVLWPDGRPVERLLLQATRDSWIDFRGIDSNTQDVRVANWEEMELNELLYFQGEVCKIFRLRRGPDSGFLMYGWNGKRIGYFDTSPTSHAVDEPCYIVRPYPPGTKLIDNGLPVFPVYYANDDDGERKRGRDSRLMFTPPKDGPYLVRVSDVRGLQGPRFAYRLTLREARPDFRVTVAGGNTTVHAGGGKTITFNVERIDGFDAPVTIEVENIPAGFTLSTPTIVEAGHFQGHAVLYAAPDAPKPSGEAATAATVRARAHYRGEEIVKQVGPLGQISLAAAGKLRVWLEPRELSIAPGGTVPAMLKIERKGFKGVVNFELFNLPHGVIVDNIGLNGVLIRENETERQIFLSCRSWVPETTRQVHAVAISAGRESSPPVTLHVRAPSTVAKASATATGER